MAQCPVFTPFLRELNRGLRKISLMLLQFAFEALEKRKRIRRGPCKPGQNFITEKRRVFRAVCFMTCSPIVTCPSAAITTLLSRRTHKTVVPCICAEFLLIGIPGLYRERRLRPMRGLVAQTSACLPLN